MDLDEETIREWKELGFYYQCDKNLKQWWLIGSRSGLSNFSTALSNYSKEISNENISEHIHLGPYQYLKIMTWHSPLINDNCIGGNLLDIKKLQMMIDSKLSKASAGEIFEMGSDYAPESEYSIKFFVMARGFDPSSIEFPNSST